MGDKADGQKCAWEVCRDRPRDRPDRR